MLIYNFKEILEQIKIKGIVHIGANKCEESNFYNLLGINNVIWIDANPNCSNIYKYLVWNKDNIDFIFNISNNSESSSIYSFKDHSIYYPDVYYKEQIKIKSHTLDTIYKLENIDVNKYNMWNICTQGSEDKVLLGAINNIKNIDVIFIKIYTKKIYENNPTVYDIDNILLPHNFKRVITENTNLGWGFSLYVKKNIVFKYKK